MVIASMHDYFGCTLCLYFMSTPIMNYLRVQPLNRPRMIEKWLEKLRERSDTVVTLLAFVVMAKGSDKVSHIVILISTLGSFDVR